MKETVLRDFLFADDCSLNTSDEQEMQDEMYSLSPACDNFGLTIPYLPVYNAHPYFGLHFGKKKKRKQKTEEVVTKELRKKIWKHSKNDNSIISSEMSLDAPATKRAVLLMESFSSQPL